MDGLEGIKLTQGLSLGLGDFELIRVIGRGSYAKVLLVRLKKNEQVYAMKVVKKELVHDDEVRAHWGDRGPPHQSRNTHNTSACVFVKVKAIVFTFCVLTYLTHHVIQILIKVATRNSFFLF